MMTPAELSAARALCEAASPGPWIARKLHLGVETSQIAKDGAAWGAMMWVVEPSDDDDPEADRIEEFDRSAAFIAASRELVPKLIAEIDRLLEDRDRMLHSLTDMRANCMATYMGGYSTKDEIEIFRHGMATVCNIIDTIAIRSRAVGLP